MNTEKRLISTEQPDYRDTVVLRNLVNRFGYRKTSMLIGKSRGCIWGRLNPEKARNPRGVAARRQVNVGWSNQEFINAPDEIQFLRRNLLIFLSRLDRVTRLSTSRSRCGMLGVQAHLKRVSVTLSKVANHHVNRIEFQVYTHEFDLWPPEERFQFHRALSNSQETIVFFLNLALLRERENNHCRNQTVAPEVIEISAQTLAVAGVSEGRENMPFEYFRRRCSEAIIAFRRKGMILSRALKRELRDLGRDMGVSPDLIKTCIGMTENEATLCLSRLAQLHKLTKKSARGIATYESLAGHFCVTRERIKADEDVALKKLRRLLKPMALIESLR